jgi:hypothetical protein
MMPKEVRVGFFKIGWAAAVLVTTAAWLYFITKVGFILAAWFLR